MDITTPAAATCPPLELSAAAGDRPSPLSHAQQSLWFLDQATPGLRTYNVPVVLRLRGDLDVAALRGALADVVARHEPLRTAFADAPGGPVQQVLHALDISLPMTQAAGEPAAREAAAWELIRADADRAFDLRRAPLWRARLVRLSQHEHVLAFVVHHAVFDGYSLDVFTADLTAAYGARTTGGQGGGLAPLPVSYRDYVRWQQDLMSGEYLADLIGFFVNMLVLRIDAAGDPTARELIDRVSVTVSEAISHGELPFALLVEALRPRRDPSRSPLFQVAFGALEPPAPVRLPGLDAGFEDVDPGGSRFDLSLIAGPTSSGGFGVEVEYSTDLFEAATTEQLVTHYEQILTQVLEHPGARVSAIGMLTPAERAELITRWNGPVLPFPATTVPQEFAARVSAAPESAALVTGGHQREIAEYRARCSWLVSGG